MKKLLALCLTLLLCLVPLAGCGGGGQNLTAPSGDGGDLPVLKVGFEAMTPPGNWTQTDDGHGAVAVAGTDQYVCGFEVDLMRRLCELAGYELEAYKYDWDGLLMAVTTGQVDCAISMISATSERLSSMDFTEAYYEASVTPVVRAESVYAEATALEGLRGARVTSMLNTLWYRFCADIPDADVQPAMENVPAMIVALQSGTVDMLLLDRTSAMAAVMANPDLAIVAFVEGGGFDAKPEDVNVNIAVHKGDAALVDALNDALSEISQEEKDSMLTAAIENQPLAQ